MQYKNIEYLKNKIFEKSPFQQKKLEDFFSKQDEKFNQDFELFLEEYIGYLNKNSLTIEYGIDAYLKMVSDMFKSQIKFMRTGKYPVTNTTEAIDNVYNDKTEMLSYMIGLALSQYLWSTHYEMFNHLKEELRKNAKEIKTYLEIGPGHGLFLKNAIDILDEDTNMTAIDISPISLEVSKSIIEYFYPNKNIKLYCSLHEEVMTKGDEAVVMSESNRMKLRDLFPAHTPAQGVSTSTMGLPKPSPILTKENNLAYASTP
jgi:hypothetical protein